MESVKVDLEAMRARSQGVIDRGNEVRAIFMEGGYKDVPQGPMAALAADVLALCAEVERLRRIIAHAKAIEDAEYAAREHARSW